MPMTARAHNPQYSVRLSPYIPARLFVRKTGLGLQYLARDIILAAACWYAVSFVDPYFSSSEVREALTPFGAEIARWASWCV